MVGVFRIERTLGIGGFGITYLAFDTSLNIQVAVKEYFPQNAWRDTSSRTVHCYAGEAEQTFQIGLQRFHKEGQILAQFKHPNIVGVRQMLSANNTAYLVMDYEHGEELEAYLRRLGRPLAYQEVENIFNPLLDGLRAVHDRGLLHLDIKPENIFLRADSTPVLIDFGGARHQLGQASRSVSFLVASDGYAPNEQYTGTQLQPTTDIYAVGATLYRSITGRVPADAPKRGLAMIDGSTDPLIPVRQAVGYGAYPEHFLQTLDDALNMRVSVRPQSVRELQQRLFQAASPASPQPRPQTVYEPVLNHQQPPITAGKTNWLPILAGSAAVLVAVFYWNSTRNDAGVELERMRHENQALVKQLESTPEVPAVAEPLQIAPPQPQPIPDTTPQTQEIVAVDGERIYKGLCFSCHNMGIAGSPKLKDSADWNSRYRRGLETLYHTALNGKGAMPAKGGNPALSDAEVTAAVDWMVSQSVSQTQSSSTESNRDETPIVKLVDDYAVVSSLNDPYAALSLYTEPTDYYNEKSASHDFIVKESERYTGVYANRQFQIVSAPVLVWLSDNEVQVTYKMSYDLCCKKNKDPVHGVNLMNMRLVQTSDGWKIAAVSSKKM
jgi:serine/threonine protein kinase